VTCKITSCDEGNYSAKRPEAPDTALTAWKCFHSSRCKRKEIIFSNFV